jgi:DNA polymerase-1
MFVFDFETGAIAPRPDYPPSPVGLAWHGPDSAPTYLSWGHPEGNTATLGDAEGVLEQHLGRMPVLGHNVSFDLAVAHERMGLPLPEAVNDTMFLAFLLDPYGELGLKPLAERYLKQPPAERDAVRDWIYEHKIVRKNVKSWGAHISKAPAGLVAPYAIGDVTRTRDLYAKLMPRVIEAGMLQAYQRECALVPMLLDNSAQGIPLARARLKRDTSKFELIFEQVEKNLRHCWKQEIGSTPPGNFDSNEELADALEQTGRIKLPKTPTGKRSVAKDSVMSCVPDGKVKGLLLYRSAIEKCLSTYMRPWLEQGSTLNCNWNQVRDYSDNGARTGRLSSSPNLQNLTNPDKYAELHRQMQAWGCSFPWIEFPNLRSYLVAPKGIVLFGRDYSQQELRMLAHYEDGVLAQAYRDHPDLDLHDYVRLLIVAETGHDLSRKHVKTINFAKIYGAGRAKLAAQMGVPLEDAHAMVDAYESALPSVRELQLELNGIGKRGECITTLGGRRYYSEPAAFRDDGSIQTFEYKLLNYLIQGSSADQTKEAMRLWWEQRLSRSTNGTRFLLTVHDELIGCAPRKDVERESAALGEYMREAFKLDVPIKSDAAYGLNFGEMEK